MEMIASQHTFYGSFMEGGLLYGQEARDSDSNWREKRKIHVFLFHFP